MPSDRLLSELERQQKYLAKLPSDYAFPLFNAKQALHSQRRSGYRNSAAAAREIVDNSIEAGADRVHVIFDTERSEGGKRLVQAVAFIDNGSGMLPQMARYALSWGGGTHFDDSSFIGKFGFGLPNASINQTRRVEVYTRARDNEPFTLAWLDIDEFVEYGQQSIPEPVASDLPEFVQRYLKRNNWNIGTGTVVVWEAPDRLTYKRVATLKEHLLDDFGVAYRYLLATKEHPLELLVEGVQVEPVHPLFIMPDARLYVPPEDGGAQLIEERFLSVKYLRDPDTGEYHLRRVEDPIEVNTSDPNLQAAGTINVRIVRFPPGFAEYKRGGDKSDANRRFDFRKSRRGMSFVRAGREIETVDLFPRSEEDRASGMGDWPLLQSYAYHWGAEVLFSPELDEVFGITNDKQGVHPVEDFWRVLHQADIDAALHRENRWQDAHRKRQPVPVRPEEPTPGEQAASNADAATGRRPQVPTGQIEDARKRLDDEIQRRATEMGKSRDEIREALEREAKRRPYRVEYFSAEYGPFYVPEWVGPQVVVRVNQKHPFYSVLYGDLLRLVGGSRAKEATDVLLIALARAELMSDEGMQTWYKTQRTDVWSRFLETALTSLSQQLRLDEEAVTASSEDDEAGTVVA